MVKVNSITYQEAIQLTDQERKERKARFTEIQKYLLEFKESNIELFDSRDFEFYSEKTGLPVEKLLELKANSWNI